MFASSDAVLLVSEITNNVYNHKTFPSTISAPYTIIRRWAARDFREREKEGMMGKFSEIRAASSFFYISR